MRSFIYTSLLIITACAPSKTSSSNSAKGNTRTTAVQSIDENAFRIVAATDDKTYGYEKNNPVKVGRVNGGPANERRYLNGLTGPDGEKLIYHRQGSCCPFKTPNGLFDNSGMLDIYRVTWVGASDTLTIFINMYDEGDLFVPVGLKAR